MTTIDRIRREIERLYDGDAPKHDQQCDFDDGYFTGIATIGKFLDTLEEPVSDCHDLEEAAETKYPTRWKKYPNDGIVRSEEYFDLNAEKREAFIAGAEWQKKQIPMPEDTVIFQKGVEEGKRLMMEGATYNELMELYRAIRDELVKRHRDVPINIKEEQ